MMLQQIKGMENQKTNSKKKATHILKETHNKRQAMRHDYLPSLLGDGPMKTVRKQIFCTEPTRPTKACQKSFIIAK
jgi:hypothetical protein